MDYTNFNNSGALRTAGALCGFPNPATPTPRIAGQCYNGNFLQGFGPTRFEFRTTDYNFFVQDDWRINPRLTLNLGMRYEYQKLPEPQQPNPAWDSDTRFTGKTNFFPADKNNFGPRFGIAYDLTGAGRSSHPRWSWPLLWPDPEFHDFKCDNEYWNIHVTDSDSVDKCDLPANFRDTTASSAHTEYCRHVT